MAKFIIVVDIPDDEFNLAHYPNCEDAEACIEYDIQQVNDGIISEIELLDGYLNKNSIIDMQAEASE